MAVDVGEGDHQPAPELQAPDRPGVDHPTDGLHRHATVGRHVGGRPVPGLPPDLRNARHGRPRRPRMAHYSPEWSGVSPDGPGWTVVDSGGPGRAAFDGRPRPRPASTILRPR